MMTNEREYPQPVKDFAAEMVRCLEGEFNRELNEEIFRDCCLEKGLEKFINGDDIEFTIEEVERIVSDAVMETALVGLMEKGLVNNIEDETGETVYFLTEEGKKLEGKV